MPTADPMNLINLPEGVEREKISWITDVGGDIIDDRVGVPVIYFDKENSWNFGMLMSISERKGVEFLGDWHPDDNYDTRLAKILDGDGHLIDHVVNPKGRKATLLLIG